MAESPLFAPHLQSLLHFTHLTPKVIVADEDGIDGFGKPITSWQRCKIGLMFAALLVVVSEQHIVDSTAINNSL